MGKRISIMGATGSIGTSTLDVIRFANVEAPGRFTIEALTAGADAKSLAAQAIAFGAKVAVIADETKLAELRDILSDTEIECAGGTTAIVEAATRPCDLLVAAIVGSAGLASTLAAIGKGTDVAIANKESIVCAGHIIKREAEKTGAAILPVDSEHNAIFQVLQSRDSLEGLTITASGGPFLNWTREEMRVATPKQAAAHPNWDMGIKNSIDSATLMNKALEFIEAAILFDMPTDAIDVLIHPQSIIHGMAHYRDGSVLAQLSAPDMKCPISYALGWPDRLETEVARLDLKQLRELTFFDVEEAKFPAIRLAKEAVKLGFGGTTILNCANEAAVSAFVEGKCGFLDISRVVEDALSSFASGNLIAMACDTLDEIAYLDHHGRELAQEIIQNAPSRAEG